MTLFDTRHLRCDATDGSRLCDLAAASGFHVTPAGELVMYATEHHNGRPEPHGPDGRVPAQCALPRRQPELRAHRARRRAVKPWTEVYADQNFEDRSVVLDWDTRFADDYDDLGRLDDFDDEAGSLVYAAPVGRDLHVYGSPHYRDRELVLPGTGRVERIPNLNASPYELGDEIDDLQGTGSALDALAAGDVGAALVRIRKAVHDLETAEVSHPRSHVPHPEYPGSAEAGLTRGSTDADRRCW